MDDVEKVKQKIDIADLISEYIPLKKAGRNFKAICPFHNEKTPSLVVSPERQIWHCFGCSKGGDQFTFLMEYDKIEFSEALKYLADKAGVKLSGPMFKTDREKKKDIIYTLNHLAANFYHYLLTTHAVGKKALFYLTDKRKISPALIEKFNLGYAPGKADALALYLVKKKGYAQQDIIDAGLATKKDSVFFDFFRNRVIFPIIDARGNTLAFSGRVLDGSTSNTPKYINTRETPVYKKGDTLFGLNLAREAIKKEERVILVEGEFDVISAFGEGIQNIVAIKGTALTINQIKALKRYTHKISFCFDTDEAGVEALKRSIELIESEAVTASVIVPPSGKDPDELLKENPALFKKALAHDINIYDYMINNAISRFDPSDAYGKQSILEYVLPILVSIENEVVKEHYFKKLAAALDTSLESLLKQAEKVTSKRFGMQKKVEEEGVFSKKGVSREELTEQYLISLIVQSKNPKDLFSESKRIIEEIMLSTPIYQRLYQHLFDIIGKQEVFTINDFAASLPTELLESFDRCYLAPLPHFTSDDKYTEEVQKIAREVKRLSIINSLKKLGSEMSKREKEAHSNVQGLQKEFHTLTKLLTPK